MAAGQGFKHPPLRFIEYSGMIKVLKGVSLGLSYAFPLCKAVLNNHRMKNNFCSLKCIETL